MMVMEEKRDKFYLKDLNLILLPHCIKCLLRLDDIFTALVGIPYNSIKEDSSWAESRLACNTCKALAARAPKCFKCDKTNDIWVCMICGKIGCGRYEGGHSLSHYSESCHNFSICLKDKIIWSYYTDNFVHRVPEKILYRSNSSRSNAEELIDRERLNSQDDKNGAISRFDGNRSDNEDRLLESNVSAMLCEQLDLQRTHYENTIEMLKEKLAHELEEQSNNQVKGLREKKQELEKGLAEKKNVLNALRKSKISLESKLREVKKQYEEEMEVQKNLESHISFIDKEDDGQIESINKDIENQKKLLEGFQAKLSDLYKQLE
jgi:BRCA1-associated protein